MLTTDWTTYGVPARMFTSDLVGIPRSLLGRLGEARGDAQPGEG